MKTNIFSVYIVCLFLIVSAACVQSGSKPDAKTAQETGRPNAIVTRQTLSFEDNISAPKKETTIPPASTPTIRKNLTFYGGASRTINGTGLSGDNMNSTTTINQTTTTSIPPFLNVFSPIITNFTVVVNGTTLPGTNGLSITKIQWDWGDGLSAESWFPATHVYAANGTYTILVTSYQSDGQIRQKTVNASIAA